VLSHPPPHTRARERPRCVVDHFCTTAYSLRNACAPPAFILFFFPAAQASIALERKSGGLFSFRSSASGDVGTADVLHAAQANLANVLEQAQLLERKQRQFKACMSEMNDKVAESLGSQMKIIQLTAQNTALLAQVMSSTAPSSHQLHNSDGSNPSGQPLAVHLQQKQNQQNDDARFASLSLQLQKLQDENVASEKAAHSKISELISARDKAAQLLIASEGRVTFLECKLVETDSLLQKSAARCAALEEAASMQLLQRQPVQRDPDVFKCNADDDSKIDQLQRALAAAEEALAVSKSSAAAALAANELKHAVLQNRLAEAEAALTAEAAGKADAEKRAAAAVSARAQVESVLASRTEAAARAQAEAESSISRLMSDLNDARKWAKHKNDADAKLALLQREVEVLNQDLAASRESLAAARTACEEQQVVLQSRSKEIEDLVRTKADAETRLAAAGSASASIEEKNASLLARLKASMIEHAALSARVVDAESRVLELQQQLAASEHARAAAEHALATSESKFAAALAQSEEKRLTISQLSCESETKILELQQQLVAAENAQAGAERALAELESTTAGDLALRHKKMAALEGRLKASDTALAAAQASAAAAAASAKEKEMAFLSKQLENSARFSSVSKERDDLKSKLDLLEQERDELKEHISRLQADDAAARLCFEKDETLRMRLAEMEELLRLKEDADSRTAAANEALKIAEKSRADADALAAAANWRLQVTLDKLSSSTQEAADAKSALEATANLLSAEKSKASKWAEEKVDANFTIAQLRTELAAANAKIAQVQQAQQALADATLYMSAAHGSRGAASRADEDDAFFETFHPKRP
jgi:hypothetical protein